MVDRAIDARIRKLEMSVLELQVSNNALRLLVCGCLETMSKRIDIAQGNPTKGSIWITDWFHNRRWYDPESIPEGYRRGRWDRSSVLPRLKVVK